MHGQVVAFPIICCVSVRDRNIDQRNGSICYYKLVTSLQPICKHLFSKERVAFAIADRRGGLLILRIGVSFEKPWLGCETFI